MRRRSLTLLTMLVLFSASGAHCLHQYPSIFGPRGPQAPRLLPEGATLEQVIDVVNNNSARVQTYSTADATITSPGMPGLRADIAIERPWRFRLRAGTGLTGPEVDLGSNDELFWLWIRRSRPPVLYFCRRDQYARSAARQVLPVEPQWLIDAMGLMSFDPGAEHRGPFLRRDGNLEIRSTWAITSGGMGPVGPGSKITVIDRTRGWVLEQYLYSPAGELLASATASDHRYDPTMGVSLPRRVSIQMPRAQLSLNIDLGNFQINRQMGNPAQTWVKPTYAGFPETDLCQPNLYLPPPAAPIQGYLPPRSSAPIRARIRSLPPRGGERRPGAWPARY